MKENNLLSVGATYKISGVHKEGLYEGLFSIRKRLSKLIVTNGGTGFTDGKYNVAILGGSGTGLEEVNVSFTGGSLAFSEINLGGNFNLVSAYGYVDGEILTIDGSLHGGGTGIVLTVLEENLIPENVNEGTTIYVNALTTNEFSDEGFGEFWNPKYTEDDGFGIYTDRSKFQPIQTQIETRETLEFATTDQNPTYMLVDNFNNILIANINSGGGTGDNGIITKVEINGISSVYCEIPDESPLAMRYDSINNELYVLTYGYVYKVSDNGANVIVLGETGSGVNGVNGGINGDGYPTDLEIYNGGAYVCKNFVNKLLYISDAGVTTQVAVVGNHPVSMLKNNDDDYLYIACMNANNVYRVSIADGTSELFAETDGMPMQITRGNDSTNIYVLCMSGNEDGGTIRQINKATAVSTVYAQVGFSPRTIYLDAPSNRFLVCSSETKTIYSIDQTTQKVTDYAVEVGDYIYSVITSFNGRMFVSDYMKNKLLEVQNNTFITLPVVKFIINEGITADNGAEGILFTTLDSGEFYPTSGDWSTATSITGNDSGAFATLMKGGKSSPNSIVPVSWNVWSKNVAVALREIDGNGSEIITPIGSYVAVPFSNNPVELVEQLVEFINNNVSGLYGLRAEVAPFSNSALDLYNDSNVYRQLRLAITTVGNPSGGTSYAHLEAEPKTSSVVQPNYPIASTTIYGGYVWENLTGNVGSPSNNQEIHQRYYVVALDEVNWKKLPYTEENYKFEIGKIKFDFANDMIIHK